MEADGTKATVSAGCACRSPFSRDNNDNDGDSSEDSSDSDDSDSDSEEEDDSEDEEEEEEEEEEEDEEEEEEDSSSEEEPNVMWVEACMPRMVCMNGGFGLLTHASCCLCWLIRHVTYSAIQTDPGWNDIS